MLSVDANILVYSTDMDDRTRQNRAVDLLSGAARTGAGLTEQSIVEFINVSRKKNAMPIDSIRMVLLDWLDSFALLTPGPTVVHDTLDLLSRYNLSTWDARLLAVCGRAGCDTLLSEDMKDGAVYNGVRVLNPFAAHNAHALAELLTL